PPDEADAHELRKLAGDRLAVGAHPGSDLGMGRDRCNPRTLALLGAETCEPKELGLDAVAHGERREFVDTRGERPDLSHELRQHRESHHRLALYQFPERGAWQRSDKTRRSCFDARRTGTAVDRGILAEHLARPELAEAHYLAGK